MTDEADLLQRAHHFLRHVRDEALAPDEARRRLQPLVAAFPEMSFRLVADRQDFREQAEYTLLVSGGEPRSTLSLAVSSTLPWPLRGMQRWSSQDLVRVDGVTLSVQQAIACVDFLWRERDIATRLVDVCVMSAEIEARGLRVEDDELQELVDAFRRGRGLHDVATTEGWMRERGLTLRLLEEHVRQQALIARLRTAVTADEVDPWFAANAASLETVTVALAFAGAPQSFAGVRHDVETRGGDFFAVAAAALRQGAVATIERRTLRRGDCAPPLAGALFGAAGPGGRAILVEVDGCPALACVLDRSAPILDAATRSSIEQRLFSEWLADRRRSARIEWNWGKTTAQWLGKE